MCYAACRARCFRTKVLTWGCSQVLEAANPSAARGKAARLVHSLGFYRASNLSLRKRQVKQFKHHLSRGVQGTLFADYGTDLDSGALVKGDPAGVREKPGQGYGYGGGVRVDTPVGPLRLEFAMNDRGLRRFHLGIGSHG